MVKVINKTKEKLFEEMKDVPYELPEGWKWVKLEDISEKIFAGGDKPKNFSKTKTDIYNIPVFANGMRNNGLLGYTNKCKVDKPCITISARGTIGYTVVRKEKFYPAVRLIVLIPKENINLEFLNYALHTVDIIKNGANIPQLTVPMVKKIVIPLPFKDGKPDLEKQKQVVEKIEALFKEINKAIELRQKAIEETKRLFDSVLDRIFREAEKDKKNWKWVKLKDLLASLESGKRPRGGAVENGIPSIGGEHLNSDGSFNFHKMKYIPEDFYKTLKKGKIKINDILVVKDGATTGKVSFVSEEFPYKKAAVNEHIFILRVKNDYIPKYVFWFLFSPGGQKEILKNFGGAAQGGINRKFVKNVDIPIPITKNGKLDLQKQRQIAEYFDSIHNKIKQLIVLQSIQLEKFGQLKESILNKAFRGELI